MWPMHNAMSVYLVVLTVVMIAGCGSDRREAETPVRAVAGPVPREYQAGERSFDTYCSGCHGVRAVGTDRGPPFVHRIYEPSHHGDQAFYRAVAFGVRAHHWGFGDMPPVSGISRDEVTGIISYIRWLQRESGIF